MRIKKAINIEEIIQGLWTNLTMQNVCICNIKEEIWSRTIEILKAKIAENSQIQQQISKHRSWILKE